MPFDSLVMAAVLHEVREAARDGQVQKVYQPAPDELILHLRGGGQRHQLLFSTHPQRFRLHLIQDSPSNPATPPQFCMVLRKHLEGSKLASVEQSGLERVARFRFERSDGIRILVAEMMGKHSNLVLLDDRERILDSIKHVSGRINRVRELLPNRPYLPPPVSSKPEPLTASEGEILDALTALGGPVSSQGIVKALANVSPFFGKEVMARADSAAPPDAAHALRELMDRVRQRRFSPTLLQDDEGQPSDAWAFECRSLPEDRQDPAPSMSLALEVSLRFQTHTTGIEELRSEAREKLDRLIGRGERRIREMREALEEAEAADDLRIRGEILQAHTHLLERGQAEARLPNYYDPDLAHITIELDPLLSPQENAEAYFRRHRKAKSSVPHLRERIEEEEGRLNRWRNALEELESAGEDRVRALLRELEPEAPAESGRKEESSEVRKPAPGVRRTQSSDGYEIWYGENKEGNDTLTSKLAAPTDLWLHVRASPSAHVVIRTQKKPENVPQRTLMEAARIAAAHSESKHSKVVPVDYTLKKYVRKPRGSGPGRAHYTHEKTLHVEQE